METTREGRVNLPPDQLEIAKNELLNIQAILQDLADGSPDYSYADTADSMESLDSLLEGSPDYDVLKAKRLPLSQQAMRGTKEEKAAAYKLLLQWVADVQSILA